MKSACGVRSTGLWAVLVRSSPELRTHTCSSTTTIPASLLTLQELKKNVSSHQKELF